jgi:peptidoglycan biosynthesis protein MviN/MurJ (putative lipid II flippase)
LGINVLLGISLPGLFKLWGWLPHSALALATAIAALIEAGILLWLIKKRLGAQEMGSLWRTAARVCLAAAGMAGVLYTWRLMASTNVVILVVVAIPLGVLVYTGLATLFGVKELWQAAQMLLHK